MQSAGRRGGRDDDGGEPTDDGPDDGRDTTTGGGETAGTPAGETEVRALGMGAGTERWRVDTGGEGPVFDDVTASPAVVEGRVYVVGLTASGASDVFAIDGR